MTLRELAEAATPGPWFAENGLFLNENWAVGAGGIGGLVAEIWTREQSDDAAEEGRDAADAAYIAAASPDVVLRLLAIEEAAQEVMRHVPYVVPPSAYTALREALEAPHVE
jgi:hypothetical protein